MVEKKLGPWNITEMKSGTCERFYGFMSFKLAPTQSPLDSKEIKPVNPKGNQHWIFTGRTDDETEAPILWPPDPMSQLVGKDLDAEKD